MYFISIYFCIKILKKLSSNNRKVIHVFLILTSINIHIPFYSGYISAESLTIFLTALYCYIFIKSNYRLVPFSSLQNNLTYRNKTILNCSFILLSIIIDYIKNKKVYYFTSLAELFIKINKSCKLLIIR